MPQVTNVCQEKYFCYDYVTLADTEVNIENHPYCPNRNIYAVCCVIRPGGTDRLSGTLSRRLKGILDATLAELEKSDLHDRIALAPTETVKNPFV